jgi:multidrug efflux system membrane fusion protein
MTPRIRLAARAAAASLACIALGAALTGCSRARAQGATERRSVPVKVRAVEKPAGVELARFSGSLEPKVRVDMAFRVGGYVEALGAIDAGGRRRTIDKGDFVTKGTVLARIRASDYEQKLATARASLNEARAQAKLAEAELDRARRLFDTKAITKAELDTQVARTETARATVDGAGAQTGEASIALDDTVLRAPMDGVILARQVEVGTLVSPGQAAIAIADVREVKAVFGVPQELVEKLHVGSPVTVFVGADGRDVASGPSARSGEKTIDARVTRVAPSADASGRVFAIEALLPNEPGALRPGAVVSVHVPEATLSAASIAVPLSAVVRSADRPRGFAVFVLDGDGDRAPARLRDVQLGEVLGNSVTVTDGLALGQRVVTVGATLLRDGSDAVVIP